MNDPTIGIQQYASPILLFIGLILGILILLLPRRFALVPLILTTCFLPLAGKYVVFGLNFSMLRIVLLFAGVRILSRNEWGHVKWITLDSVVLGWAVYRVLAFTMLWQNAAALVNGLGYAYDQIGLYFTFRVFLTTPQELKRTVKLFALVLLPVAMLMCVEKVTGTNPFYILGGVPQFAEVREGVTRCQGPFGHPILAGTFGAVWFPLFLGLWLQGKGDRLMAGVGMLASTLMTVTSGSSGPVGTYAAGIIGMLMWSFRHQMRMIRWSIVACIVGLDLVMNDPVWFVLARVNVLSGSTGWHRANLINQTIRHFWEWWLVGAKDIVHWGVFAGDTTNQFVAEGIRAGIVAVALFIAMVVIGFSYVGRSVRRAATEPKRYRLLLWSVGVCVFSNVVSFMGVAYFDQNIANWFLVLAAAAMIFTYTAQQQRARKSNACAEDIDVTHVVCEESLAELTARSTASAISGSQAQVRSVFTL